MTNQTISNSIPEHFLTVAALFCKNIHSVQCCMMLYKYTFYIILCIRKDHQILEKKEDICGILVIKMNDFVKIFIEEISE